MSKKKSTTARKKGKDEQGNVIVAIGASAGGIEAVTELLKNLPADTGMVFIYVQHLDPTQKSMLSAILAKVTPMGVEEVKQRSTLRPNRFYIIPPNKEMSIKNGTLLLTARQPKPVAHMPIDKFFTSLATNYKDGIIGIILSGSATDGVLGLKEIKTAGGVTIAQDETATFQSMPRSAIAEGVVDLILPPAKMAAELVRISHQRDTIQLAMKDVSESEISNTDESLINIIHLLRKSVGVDFANYKMNTIKRRIVRRMLIYKLKTLKEYHQYLRQHTTEINALYQDLLINVTSFFRDAAMMEYLKKTLLPKMLKNKHPNDPFRVWVPACSTGEEAYSMAMTLVEVLGDRGANTAIQVFATDLSETAIAKARLGLYSRTDVADVSPKRLQRFFAKVDGSYRIVKSIRDLVVFAPHNIVKDPPFSRLDLISCCNLMIYLEPVLQKKIISTFHYALNRNGYLVLGKSEAVNASAHLFSQLEKKYKIYSRKKDSNNRAILEASYRIPRIDMRETTFTKKLPLTDVRPESDLEKTVDAILLSKHTPANVVVTRDLDILQFRGSTGLYLENMPGKASLNLLKMARPGLGFELRNAVHKAAKTGAPVEKRGLQIVVKGTTHNVGIEVVPLKTDSEDRLFLILFSEMPVYTSIDVKSSMSRDRLVKKLQQELLMAKEDMRSIIEEQEAGNEELQSINEELETSKEEVESTNEELMTINTELQIRNEQLAEAYEYSESVFDTIREAVLVLDKDLRVKTANRSFYKIFQTREEDTLGVLIYELGSRQWNIPKLRELLEEIVPENSQINGFEVSHVFPGIGEKIMMLNARRVVQKIHKQQLVLLAIEDITEHRLGQRIIAERESWIRHTADNVPVMIWVANTSKVFTFVNKTWLEYTGRKLKDENDWIDVIHKDDVENYLKTFHLSFTSRKPFKIEYRLRRKDGEYRWIMDAGKPTFNIRNEFSGYLGSCTEIHDRRMLNEELERQVTQRTYDLTEANKNLQVTNGELEQFAYVASHDLQEPLRKIRTFADKLQQQNLAEPATLYLEKIWDSSERMSKLIDDLLNFSRASSAPREDVDLNLVLKEVLVDFEDILNQKKGKVKTGKLPVIPAISVQMAQLLHNLISNSLKFAKDGRAPLISISCRTLPQAEVKKNKNLEANTPHVELVLKDNGIGFSAKYAKQIFIIFQRVADKKFPGTGIGLALCRKIVNNHRGDIFATSRPNDGASFHVILPLR